MRYLLQEVSTDQRDFVAASYSPIIISILQSLRACFEWLFSAHRRYHAPKKKKVEENTDRCPSEQMPIFLGDLPTNQLHFVHIK